MILDERIQNYFNLHPAEFPIVDRLELRQIQSSEGAPPVLNLTLLLRSDEQDTPTGLLLSFFDVKNLQLASNDSLLQVFLEIRQIRDYQWESIAYHITSGMDGLLTFYCRDFEVTLQTPTTPIML